MFGGSCLSACSVLPDPHPLSPLFPLDTKNRGRGPPWATLGSALFDPAIASHAGAPVAEHAQVRVPYNTLLHPIPHDFCSLQSVQQNQGVRQKSTFRLIAITYNYCQL
jgi:hypothetical protein